MVIHLDTALAAALTAEASRSGTPAAELAVATLRRQFLTIDATLAPRDEWERRLLGAASDCGVSLPHEAFVGEALYE